MATNDLVLQLIIKAVDLATKDIDGVHDKLENLKTVLLGNEFDRSAEGMQSFGQAVKDSTEPLAAAAKNTLALSAAMTGVASYMASNAYKAAKDYESALADLAKVLDGGKEEAKAYGDQLNALALRYGQNGQQLVAAMANFVQAGYKGKEAFDLVEQSVKLMIAGELEAGDSSQYLISILKGFKAPASEAASTVDLLNEVSNRYATDVKQLAIGMAALSPIAKQMNFTMAETAGMLTPVIEVYGSGAEAADALKTGLQQLINDTAPVKDALYSLGVSQFDLNGKLRSGKDILLDVSKAMVGLDAAQKQYVIGQLVGIEQAGRMSQVFDNLAGYLGATDAALNSAGSAMKEVENRLETAEAKGKKAEESFRQLSVTLGNTFKPQITGVIAATGDLAAAFDKAVQSGDLAPLLNVIKPQIAAVENLFSAMAANLDKALDGVDWKPLVDGIKAFSGEFGQAMGALTDGMDLTTVEGLRNLLQALINLMGNFSQYVAGVVDGLEPFLDSLNLLFGAVSTNLPTFANLAGQITGLATSANQVIPVLSSLGGTIFGAIGSVIELTAKIGLLVAGLKLLSAVGIPVGEILSGLTARFLALNPAVAGLLSALVGLPGLVAGLTAAAGGLGVAIGMVVNKTVEWATGGQSIGSMLYDLVHGSDEAEKAITKVATAEELAAAAAKRHADALKAKQDAEQKAAEESAKIAKQQEDKLKLHAQEEEALQRLEKQYAAMGLVYDRVTGAITRQGEVTAKQRQESIELGIALDKVGVKANYMSDRITAGGQETIATFRKITQNAQATSKQIEAAFKAAISSAETQAEVQKILAAYREWAAGAKRGAADVAGAIGQADAKTKELRRSTEGLSMAERMYAASGDSAQEVKRKMALASGDLATALQIEKEQHKGATSSAQENTAATQQNTDAQGENAKTIDNTGESYKRLIEMLNGARERTKALSEAAGAYFEMQLQGTLNQKGLAGAFQSSGAAAAAFEKAVAGGGGELAKFETEIANARAAQAELRQEMQFTVNMLDTYETAIGLAEAATKQAFYEQSAQAEQYRLSLEDLVKTGANLSDAPYLLEQATKAANGELYLLDQQDLSGLRSAIDSANNKLRQMQDEAQAAQDRLAELDAQIARERGNTDAADRMDLEREKTKELADAEKALAEARAANNQALVAQIEEQIRKLNELYALKEQNLEQDIRERARNAASTTTGNTSSAAPSGGSGGGAPGGGGVTNVTNNFYTDPTQLATEEWYRQKVLPVQDKINRLRR